MNGEVKEKEIIYLAVDSFKKKFPEVEAHIEGNHFRVTFDNQTIDLEIVVKKDLSTIKSFHPLVKMLTPGKEGRKVVISQNITREIAYLLKEKRVSFLDIDGNTHLRTSNILIFILDKHRPKRVESSRVRRLFYSSGLRLIFNLLSEPGLVNENYRRLSKISDVSLGSVGWIMKDLREMNYLLLMDENKKRIINKEKLLEKWIEGYGEKLRPTLIKGGYRFAKNEKRKDLESLINKFPGTFWGGEIAAELCTGYLRAEKLTLYTTDNIMDIIKELKLVPDPDGSIEILDVFWDTDYYKIHHASSIKNVAPVLLIYADLVISGDARNLETAKVFYEKYLQGIFE